MSDHPLIFLDTSNIARACWHPAQAAEDAGKKALAEHAATCPTFADAQDHGADCCAAMPKQYNAHEVFKTNLRAKVQTIVEHTGEEPSARWVWAVDDHCQWRRDAVPGYKGKRDKSAFDPRPEGIKFLAAEFPQTHWAQAPGHEADDVIAALVAKRGQHTAVIVSGDKDLWQLLGDGVKVFQPTKKTFVTPEMVAEEFGVPPRLIPLYKAFWGDTSDNLPNLCPRQQKVITPFILGSDGTPETIIRHILESIAVSDKVKGVVEKNAKSIGANYVCALLNQDVRVVFDRVIGG